MVRRARTERAAASKAVRELRELIGYSQTELAGRLDVSLGTVARWETSNPPQGEVLLKLADIAKAEGVEALRPSSWLALRALTVRFQVIFADELINFAPAKLIWEPASVDRNAHGYLFMKIDAPEGLRAASSFLSLIPALNSKSKDVRDAAIAIADRLVEDVEKLDGSEIVKGIRDALHPKPTRKKSRKE
jgi:transcriptional regulator with XRE-family HTH domain